LSFLSYKSILQRRTFAKAASPLNLPVKFLRRDSRMAAKLKKHGTATGKLQILLNFF
jgi:hypothetical protein